MILFFFVKLSDEPTRDKYKERSETDPNSLNFQKELIGKTDQNNCSHQRIKQ